jgi:GT2 family glycosyltransferase
MTDDSDSRAGPSVSVVIPTIGRGSLADLVNGLSGDPALCEIVIVDDHRAGSKMVSVPDVAIVVCSGGRGPAAARQLGAERCSGEILLVLDDDVRAGSTLATDHARRHMDNPGVVVIGELPLRASPLSPVQELYREDYARWSAQAKSDDGYALTRLWGGHFSVRRSDALAVGLENPRFHGYRHEDLDLGLRMAAAGLRGLFDPSLSVEHRYERSVDRFLEDAWWQGAEWTSLRALHPEATLAAPRERYTAGLSRPVASVAEIMADPRAIVLSRRTLAAARRASAFGGAGRVHRRLLQLSRRVEQLNGAGHTTAGR